MGQDDLNENMRKILIDWLVDVCIGFKFKNETLYLTIHIIDQYI